MVPQKAYCRPHCGEDLAATDLRIHPLSAPVTVVTAGSDQLSN